MVLDKHKHTVDDNTDDDDNNRMKQEDKKPEINILLRVCLFYVIK